MEGVPGVCFQCSGDRFLFGFHHCVRDERVRGQCPVFVGFGRARGAEFVLSLSDSLTVRFVLLTVASAFCYGQVCYSVEQWNVGDVHDLGDLALVYVVVVRAAFLGGCCHVHIEATCIKHGCGVCQEIVNEVTCYSKSGRYNDIRAHRFGNCEP